MEGLIYFGQVKMQFSEFSNPTYDFHRREKKHCNLLFESTTTIYLVSRNRFIHDLDIDC